MDSYNFIFQDEEHLQDILRSSISSLPSLLPTHPRSAFVDYNVFNIHSHCFPGCSNAPNIHRRIIGFLRRTKEMSQQQSSTGMSREFRHMMKERQRRKRLSQSYADLRDMLATKSQKRDKISIVQSAGEYLRELEKTRNNLQSRKRELEMMADWNGNKTETLNIKLHVQDDSLSIATDSKIAALRCLKKMELKVTAIRMTFSDSSLAIEADIQSEVSLEKLERTIMSALNQLGCRS